ncbi:MAG: HesB/IscA family protein [Nevskiales bacterium]
MAIELTQSAAQRITEQLHSRGSGLGLRVQVKETGCSGYGYVMDYADEIGESDIVFEGHGAKLVVDPDSLQLLDGSTLDFVREGLNRMFRFNNPNATGACGCGESFTVGEE